MRNRLLSSLVAFTLTFTATEATPAPIAQKSLPSATLRETAAHKDTQAPRPFRAVLRYGPATTSACRSFSENSSAICLLLAFHVIQLSQKTVSETRL